MNIDAGITCANNSSLMMKFEREGMRSMMITRTADQLSFFFSFEV
jgi:hypothetical protein